MSHPDPYSLFEPVVSSSKSQRKKRRAAAKSQTPSSPVEDSVIIPDAPFPALGDRTLNETNIKEANLAHDLEPASASETPTYDDLNSTYSPVIELVQNLKRMRALNKKIVCFLFLQNHAQQSRIASHAITDYEKLADDQKRSLKTLPSLEAVYKELEDVKKLIEAHEAEVCRDQASKLAEAERVASSKIQETVLSAQDSYLSRNSLISTLLRLRSVLGDVPPAVLGVDDSEGSAIFAACDTLLGEENDAKHTILSGLLSGVDSFDGESSIEKTIRELRGTAKHKEDSLNETIGSLPSDLHTREITPNGKTAKLEKTIHELRIQFADYQSTAKQKEDGLNEIINSLRADLGVQSNHLNEQITNLQKTTEEFRAQLADSKRKANGSVQELPTGPANSQQKAKSLANILRVHQKKHKCESLYAEGNVIDAAQLLLDIVRITDDAVKSDMIIMNWLSDFTDECVMTLEQLTE